MDRLHVIFLSNIDKETGITLLCAAAVLFLTFLGIGIAAGNLLQLRGILIIAYKTPELTCNDTFYYIVLVHPVQTAEYLGQKTLNPLLIHLDALQVINYLIKLLLANLGSGRHCALNKLLAYGLLYKAYLTFLTKINDRDGCACLACTPGTAAAVGVILDVVGQTEVDYMGEVIHIKTAGSHISSN